MSRTLHLAEQLISLPSITPEDAGCLDLLAERLAPLGFVCERRDSGPADFRVEFVGKAAGSAIESCLIRYQNRSIRRAYRCRPHRSIGPMEQRPVRAHPQ